MFKQKQDNLSNCCGEIYLEIVNHYLSETVDCPFAPKLDRDFESIDYRGIEDSIHLEPYIKIGINAIANQVWGEDCQLIDGIGYANYVLHGAEFDKRKLSKLTLINPSKTRGRFTNLESALAIDAIDHIFETWKSKNAPLSNKYPDYFLPMYIATWSEIKRHYAIVAPILKDLGFSPNEKQVESNYNRIRLMASHRG